MASEAGVPVHYFSRISRFPCRPIRSLPMEPEMCGWGTALIMISPNKFLYLDSSINPAVTLLEK